MFNDSFSKKEWSKKKYFDELYHIDIKLCEKGSFCNQRFKIAYDTLKETIKTCKKENLSLIQSENGSKIHGDRGVEKENVYGNLLHNISLLDSQVSKQKLHSNDFWMELGNKKEKT